MPRVHSHLLGLVDSDSEDGLGGPAFTVARSVAAVRKPKTHPAAKNATNVMPPAKKGAAGRQAANKVTKPVPKTATRRAGGRVAAAVDEAMAGGRVALEEMSMNEAAAKAPGRGRGRKAATVAVEEEQEVEDSVMSDAPAITTPPDSDTAKPKPRGRPKKAPISQEEATPPAKAAPARGRRGAARKAEVEAEAPEEQEATEIPETQQTEPIQEDDSHIDNNGDDLLADLPARFSSDPAEPNRSANHIPGSVSKRPLHSSADGGDPALRRRLGELTQKYESLEAKYNNLRDIAVREAERNFDRLKKQSEEKSKAAEELIASLKAEVSTQKEASRETARLKKQLETAESKASTLESKVADLTASLAESRTEIKALNMKLTAARNAEAAAAAKAQVPGSAMKGSAAHRGGGGGGLGMATSEAVAQATLSAQKKEDLYGDLTGLIVRSVKTQDGEDVFDCIQTGRNGTLHFKLALDADGASADYDEVQFTYMPQLDPNRDRDLIDGLPDYLVEEITFPRPHAAKFYARVMKALTEQL